MTTEFNSLNKKLSQYMEDAIGEAGHLEVSKSLPPSCQAEHCAHSETDSQNAFNDQQSG